MSHSVIRPVTWPDAHYRLAVESVPEHAGARSLPLAEETWTDTAPRPGCRWTMKFSDITATLLLAQPLMRLTKIYDLGADLAKCAGRLDFIFSDQYREG